MGTATPVGIPLCYWSTRKAESKQRCAMHSESNADNHLLLFDNNLWPLIGTKLVCIPQVFLSLCGMSKGVSNRTRAVPADHMHSPLWAL